MQDLTMKGFSRFVSSQDRDRTIDHTMWYTCAFAEYITDVLGEGEESHMAIDHVRNNFRDPFNELKMYPNTLCSIMNHGGDVDAQPFSPPHDFLDEICRDFPHEERITTYGLLHDLMNQFPKITQPLSLQ